MSFNHNNKGKFAALLAALIVAVSVTGCANTDNNTSSDSTSTADNVSQTSTVSDDSTDSEMLTDRDKEVGYDESSAVTVAFSSSGATASSDSVTVSGSKVTLKDDGTYIITGTTADGQIIVDSVSKTKIQIVLKNTSITCKSSAALYVKQADKVFVTTAKDSENTLASTGEYVQTDDNNVDAAVFSKDDITLNGEATITGGIFVAAGSTQMAQNFGENSTQGSMFVNTNSSGEITLKNSSGEVLVSFTPTKTYACVVISCPQITTGQTYTVTAGEYSTEVEMTSLIYGSGGMGGPNGMGGRDMNGMERPNDLDMPDPPQMR